MDALIENINLIVTLLLFGGVGIAMLWCVIWGIVRGTLRSSARLATYLVSAGLALAVLALVSSAILPLVEPNVQEAVLDFVGGLSPEATDIINASPDLVNYLLELVTALISPILFAIFFCIFIVLSYPVYWFGARFIPKREEGIRPGSRVGGAAISVASAFIMCICLMMPLTGYISYAANTYPVIMETGLVPEDTVPAEVDHQLVEAKDNAAIKVINTCGGNLLFGWTSKVDDSTATKEIDSVITAVKDTLPAVMQLMEDNEELINNPEDGVVLNLDALEETILPSFKELQKNSPRLTGIFVDVLHEGAKTWKSGDTFLGVNLDEMLGDYSSSADVLLDRLIGTTPETVADELGNFGKSMVLLSRTYNYLLKITKTDDIHMDELSEDIAGIISDLTPETAEIFKETLNSDLIESANIGNESAKTIVNILGDTLVDIAEINDPVEQQREADAINKVLSLASKTRGDSVNAEEMVDAVLDSQVLSSTVESIAKRNSNPTVTKKQEIKVDRDQKRSVDNYIDKMISDSRKPTATEEEQLTEAQIETLQSIKLLIVARNSSSNP